MTLDLKGRPTTPTTAGRLTARSSIAGADIELARNTHAELVEPNGLDDAGEWVISRLRRFVVGDADTFQSRS
ncbi:MAG TPA: hypothetical protein VM344_06230 [Vitreimonas sp.]|nr:hypothetical protein [Vitreimonas sp.]